MTYTILDNFTREKETMTFNTFLSWFGGYFKAHEETPKSAGVKDIYDLIKYLNKCECDTRYTLIG